MQEPGLVSLPVIHISGTLIALYNIQVLSRRPISYSVWGSGGVYHSYHAAADWCHQDCPVSRHQRAWCASANALLTTCFHFAWLPRRCFACSLENPLAPHYHADTCMGAGNKADLIRTAVFANGTAGARYVSADGTWLSIPDAALIGSANNSGAGADTAVLLTLSNPVYDAAAQVCICVSCLLTCGHRFAPELGVLSMCPHNRVLAAFGSPLGPQYHRVHTFRCSVTHTVSLAAIVGGQ